MYLLGLTPHAPTLGELARRNMKYTVASGRPPNTFNDVEYLDFNHTIFLVYSGVVRYMREQERHLVQLTIPRTHGG